MNNKNYFTDCLIKMYNKMEILESNKVQTIFFKAINIFS